MLPKAILISPTTTTTTTIMSSSALTTLSYNIHSISTVDGGPASSHFGVYQQTTAGSRARVVSIVLYFNSIVKHYNDLVLQNLKVLQYLLQNFQVLQKLFQKMKVLRKVLQCFQSIEKNVAIFFKYCKIYCKI